MIDVDEPTVLQLVHLLDPEFYVSVDAAREAVRLRRMFNAIHLDSGFKVDLIVLKTRPFSAAELGRREPGTLAGRQVDFATAEDTILTKLEWARASDSDRQYGDAVSIVSVQGSRLDWPYLERWAVSLGVEDLFGRARRGEPFRA